MPDKDENKKGTRSKFQRHSNILIWKSYLQRQRRWRALVAESLVSGILFLIAVFIAKPVFLTPMQAHPDPALSDSAILKTLNALERKTIVGFAPNVEPFVKIMNRAAALLEHKILSAPTEDDLNNMLYESSTKPIKSSVIWIIWTPDAKADKIWNITIRSTERALYETKVKNTSNPNPHLVAGFLAVQMAISQAIVEHSASGSARYSLSLVAMPVSPLMEETKVRKAITSILLCFTLALIPPVLETESLVVHETLNNYKRALRIRSVEYSAMYFGWLVFAIFSALPSCLLAAVSLILIFRWIHLVFALVLMMAYVSVMIMMALIMAMFHKTGWVAGLWTTLFTLLQTYLAQLLVDHKYDWENTLLGFLMHVLLPPLGLVHAFYQFALLQTGNEANAEDSNTLFYTIVSWSGLNLVYFLILLLLQRTIGQERAIGGQVSWKDIIFKKVEDKSKLHVIENPSGKERERLQEVEELVAKAISFRDVSKSIMGVPVLSNITLDIYRGDFTVLFAERMQQKMINTIEDLLTGLAFADKGTIVVLGHTLKPKKNYMTVPHMMGYCHDYMFLIDDLTVEEHFGLFLDICLWSESRQYISEYGDVRTRRLIKECHLEVVRHERVKDLDVYYKAQLCWAIALLLEPRIVMMPNYTDTAGYDSVINDKVVQYKKYVTIVKMCFTSIKLEYADRVFLFDSKILTFGGTPAYMFLKYGREYRVRMTIRSDSTFDDESTTKLLKRSTEAGATIRAHQGSLIILRLPVSPTKNVVDLVTDLTKNANKYGMTTLNISVPDSDEVYRRAITEVRTAQVSETPAPNQVTGDALKRISEPVLWKRKETVFSMQLRNIGLKYFAFIVHYRFFFMITLLSAISAAIGVGLSFSSMLEQLERDFTAKLIHGDLLTVENVDSRTTLVIRSDTSEAAKSLASAYVLSETNATKQQVAKMMYTALNHNQSLTEYLATVAIDSPQMYVYMYAYGLDVYTDRNTLFVQALYSPLHFDNAVAARSIARSYTALLRYYSKNLEASIRITDDPLALDLTSWMLYATRPPLSIQFLLIMSLSHITLLPSKEHGLIRHLQSHATNFSPARYWFNLYLCDLVLYSILATLMTGMMMLTMYLATPVDHFQYEDLLIVPFSLIMYGVGGIPQAYLFSLGPRAALNAMTFFIVNLVFGETTIIANLFYGDTFNVASLFMNFSPLFNMAYAVLKIKQVFLYNSECIIFTSKNLCSEKTLHKCCQKCGVLQKCFTKQKYLPGILKQMTTLATMGAVYFIIILLIEYKIIQMIWIQMVSRWITSKNLETEELTPGAAKEKEHVLDKINENKTNRSVKVDTFGEYLLGQNLAKKQGGIYTLHSVYLGLAKGEALALSGLKRHGRLQLCEILAGYTRASEGKLWCMSKWKQQTLHHMYARQISFSSEHESLPHWMTVYDALELIGLLRGIPREHIRTEINNYIEALELQEHAHTQICRMSAHDRTRVRFAAAVLGAPPVIVLDECTAYQTFSVRRAMYFILYHLRKRGHAVFISSSSVESHMPVTNRIAILLCGRIYDIDTVDNLVERYSKKGYTVVLHLKEPVDDVTNMFKKYFKAFAINDTSEVLVNVQILEEGLTWASIFQKMEALKTDNDKVYSYIVTVIPINYIYNSILLKEADNKRLGKKSLRSKFSPSDDNWAQLKSFEPKYGVTELKELPWSVIFNT